MHVRISLYVCMYIYIKGNRSIEHRKRRDLETGCTHTMYKAKRKRPRVGGTTKKKRRGLETDCTQNIYSLSKQLKGKIADSISQKSRAF